MGTMIIHKSFMGHIKIDGIQIDIIHYVGIPL